MANFLTLHAAVGDYEVLVNVDQVRFMRADLMGSKSVTLIAFSDRSSVYVRETLKDILDEVD